MAYKRVTAPCELASGDNLTRAMTGIGMRFVAIPIQDPNIEDTLLAASIEGMVHDDLRTLSMLITWLQIHYKWINADRLIRAVSNEKSIRVRAFWAAIAVWLKKDRRFARMINLYTESPIDVLKVGADFQIKRKGEDPRFKNTPLCVPANILRYRQSDVLTPTELAKIHRTYRQRILMGPTYRTDMWVTLESRPSLLASELARRTYGSFATAWQVKHDFEILVTR